jgi:coenzyme F420-reducing hydrogenase delta subunit
MYNMSAAEGPKFAQAANEMTERVKQLGPSPVRLRRERRRSKT